jgi:hypothetical protein
VWHWLCQSDLALALTKTGHWQSQCHTSGFLVGLVALGMAGVLMRRISSTNGIPVVSEAVGSSRRRYLNISISEGLRTSVLQGGRNEMSPSRPALGFITCFIRRN